MYILIIWPINSIPRYLCNSNENIFPYKDFYAVVHSIVCKRKNLEQFKDRWINKWIVVHPSNGTLLSMRKERNISTCNKIGEPQILYVKWEKPDTKDNILYNSIYVQFVEQVKPYTQKADQWFPGTGGDWLQTGARELLW